MNIFLDVGQKESKKISDLRGLTDAIMQSMDEEEKMSAAEKAEMDERILAKLKAGRKLTQKEMDYLRRTNPTLYAHARRVQMMAEELEEQLKHAKSKEEVNRIISATLGGLSKTDPDREYVCAAINRIATDVRRSAAYNRLPDTEDTRKKRNIR